MSSAINIRTTEESWPEEPIHEPKNKFRGKLEDWPMVQVLDDMITTDWGHHLAGQIIDCPEVTMSLVVVKPGYHHPTHFHVEGPHIATILKGKGTMRVGDQEFSVEPGMVVIIPPSAVHYSHSDGPEPLEYVQFIVPNRAGS